MITLPNGSQATAGGTITVTLDTGGDRRVAGFRHSLGTTSVDATVASGVRGGTATVDLAVGDITGHRQLFAAAVDRFGPVGPLSQVTVSITPAAGDMLTGTVLNGYTWQPIACATVTLAPGGLQVITGRRRRHAGHLRSAGRRWGGGDCPATFTQSLELDGQGLYFQFYLFPECAPEQ